MLQATAKNAPDREKEINNLVSSVGSTSTPAFSVICITVYSTIYGIIIVGNV